MNQAVAVQQEGETETWQKIDAITGILAVIERAATNPQIDPDKMQKLLDMQLIIMERQAKIEFDEAMAKLQPNLPVISHKSQIKHNEKVISTYTKYEDIDPIIRPLYTAEGFSISFDTKQVDGKTLVVGTLSHKRGHSKTAEMALPLDTSGAKNNIQAMGSTISYGKRYVVGMLLNIVTKGEDDDGASVSFLDTEKAAEIDLLISQSGADRAKFLAFMGVDDVRHIRAAEYKKAMNALKAKQKGKAA